MRYGSVCSGIEAASVAWHRLGWLPQWFAEIAPFPSRVLAHRWPGVLNYGDFTAIGTDAPSIDLLVGGTPCQAFSVAGLRLGLADQRGNLALEFFRLAQRTRPRWIVWENVPGVLSSNGGRDFGAILGSLGELGYGFAYRVLDACFFGVPQSRRRVFVVGYLGDWRPPTAVLFEREGLFRNPPTRKQARHQALGAVEASPAQQTALTEPIAVVRTLTTRAQRNSPKEDTFVLADELVRRLTPLEYERLQGLPDNYTAIPGASNTPRYHALGNSMAVPVMWWIGQRIQWFEDLTRGC